MINIFSRILYFDEKKITEYMSRLSKESVLEIKNVEISTEKDIGLKIYGFGGNYNGSTKYIGKYKTSILDKYNKFEELLINNNFYFDFIENPDLDITTVGRSSIIKFDGYINIPEKFDLLETFDKKRDSVDFQGMEVFILPSEKIKIPLITELNELTLCAKLISGNLLEEYSELQELEDSNVTILARVSTNLKRKDKEIYDPLKDYINLNRKTRKVTIRNEILENIYSENDYREIEILAIYQ